MRILFLTHRLPFPPNKGDKIRSFNMLAHLSRRHEVYVASLVDDAADLRFLPEVEKLAARVLWARIDSPFRKLIATRSLLLGRAITLDYFYSRQLQREIDVLLAEQQFDVLFCYSSPMAEYVFRSTQRKGVADARKFMDFIDIDSYKWQQYARASSAAKLLVYKREARQLAAYERCIGEQFQHLFVVSEQERNYFPGGAPMHLHALSNGVDLDYFSPRQTTASPTGERTLVFTGVMDYWPNVEGVKWFVECVLPRIQMSVPNVRLRIVGSRPNAEVRRLQSENVEVTGFVPDIREYLAGACVCVVPLRIARGVQNKVLEAMSMGKAVVTTPQAFEGIRAVAGQDLIVAADESSFANEVIGLLRDEPRAKSLGMAARSCMAQHYGWPVSLSLLDELLQA